MGFIQTGKCPVMTPLGRAMTGRPWIWWSKYDKPNRHKILKDLDLKSLLRWSVKTSFSASTLSSLKPVVESMFPGKNKLFSKTSYWHSICNFTCANTWPNFTNQGGFRWPWTNRYRRGGPLWYHGFIYLVLMLFDAQDGSQSSSSLSSFRSEQEHIGSSSTQSRSRYFCQKSSLAYWRL